MHSYAMRNTLFQLFKYSTRQTYTVLCSERRTIPYPPFSRNCLSKLSVVPLYYTPSVRMFIRRILFFSRIMRPSDGPSASSLLHGYDEGILRPTGYFQEHHIGTLNFQLFSPGAATATIRVNVLKLSAVKTLYDT